jgi:hypothetical protein
VTDGRSAIMGLVLNQGLNNRWAMSNHGISAESGLEHNRWAISNHGISAVNQGLNTTDGRLAIIGLVL